VIEGVNSPQGAPGAGQSTPVRARAGGAGFAAAMSAAARSEEGATAAEERIERVRRAVRPPRGERWEPVAGRSDYADVVSGPRNGYFVNLQDGPRQGEVFHRVRKDGREFHVYGEGRDRTVIEVRRQDTKRDPDDVKPREGEAFEPVQGHRDYQRIEGGDRDDLFINLSGNDRTGRAFCIEERDGQRFHVYGSGDNALEIRVGWRRDARDGDDSRPQEREDR
jgi:hypothetical protein